MVTVYLIRNKKCRIESNTKLANQVAVHASFLTLLLYRVQ